MPNTEDAGKAKLTIAAESIVAMMGHLGAGDRFGVVLERTRSVLGTYSI